MTIRVRGPRRGEQPAQRIGFERDAARGRREARPRHMDEHRAAAAGDARPGVVVELDDEVVEMVGAPQPVAGMARAAAGPAGCSGGRAGPRTSRRRAGCAGPAAACAAAAAGRPATTAAAAGTRRAACRRRPRACWPGCRRGRAPPAAPAARPSASRGCGRPALHAPGWCSSDVILRMGCKVLALLVPECSTSRKAAGLCAHMRLGGPGNDAQ